MARFALVAGLFIAGLTAAPGRAEQALYYNYNNAPLGPYKPAYSYLPHQSFSAVKPDIVAAPFKTHALRLFPEAGFNYRAATFRTTQIDARHWKQLLTVWAGSFGTTAGTIEFKLSRTPDDIYAAFTARDGKLIVKSAGKETVFGSYNALKSVGGKNVATIHSVFILNDLVKQTFKVTVMTPEGESFSTAPLSMPITHPFNISPLDLEIRFPNPLEPVMYTIDDLGISASFKR